MKRRELSLRTQVLSELRSGQGLKQRHPLLEPGTYVIEERTAPDVEPTPLVAGLSFGAAHQWISILEREVEKFIEDNSRYCRRCGCQFMVLIEGAVLIKGVPTCPSCGVTNPD